jgi:hypothetical protein
MWPEFDWETGYKAFLRNYRPRCDHQLLRPTPGLEALARCVTETEATMMYRCLGAYTTDPELQSLMRKMSNDEVTHYAYFRKLFTQCNLAEGNSIWRCAITIASRSKVVRDEDIALAFAPVNKYWNAPKPFQPMCYKEFLRVAGDIIGRSFPSHAAKRMLFSPLRTGKWIDQALGFALAAVIKRQYS